MSNPAEGDPSTLGAGTAPAGPAAPPRWWSRQLATWRAEVLALAVLSALPVTLVDWYLLDRKLGVFSGGYLAEHQIRAGGIGVFAVLSLLTDVAVLAPIIAAVLWIGRLLWMHALARAFLAVSVALAAATSADVAVYELQRYVGDLVNVRVLVDLLGGDVREILFFGVSPALHWLAFMSLGGLAVLAASLWLDSMFPSTMRQDPGARWTTFVAIVGVLLAAIGLGAVTRMRDPAIDRALQYKPSGRVLGSVTQWLTDVDRDGFGLLSMPADQEPFDASRHPYALEVPGNGLDEDGVGGDLPAASPYREPVYGPITFQQRPDVVFVILETFRADAVGATLNGRPVTPTLDRLRARGAAARRAFSHNGFTVQSRYHAFTGHLNGPGDPGSLIDDFNANGYQTAFFSAQDETFGADFDVGFDRAQVRYDARVDRDRRFTQFSTPASLTVSYKVLEERVGTFLEGRSAATPLFLHLNIQDGHFPYVNPDIATLVDPTRIDRDGLPAADPDRLRRMYLNTLANVDASLGRMLARVEKTTGRRPGVLIIADHGESLFDAGFLGHGYAANDAQTLIPFIVDGLSMTIPDPVGQLDVRRLLREALSTASSAPPTVIVEPERRIYQYVGTQSTPRTLAWATYAGREEFDLVRRDMGDSTGASSSRVALIHFWERLRLAAAERRR